LVELSWCASLSQLTHALPLLTTPSSFSRLSPSPSLSLSLSPPPLHSTFREWQLGIALFAGGNILNFVSFGFAAQSLLAALGSVQFVSNVFFARFVLHEAITPRVLGATALIVVGCVLLVSFGNHQSELLTAQELMNNYKK
jgi:magnesium transporter